MLIFSRDAISKMEKHAWHVFPLEAFGYLLGRQEVEGMRVYAALPCSKTEFWYKYDDRWNGIDESLVLAQRVAVMFDLEVVGLYASRDDFDTVPYPMPECFVKYKMKLKLLYRTICCRSCSALRLGRSGRWLEYGEDYCICRGKRISNALTQKKVMQQWIRVHGSVDYGNNYKQALHTGDDGVDKEMTHAGSSSC